jgi:hypothetical protein
MKDHYGIDVTTINDLDNMTAGNVHYIYEDVHFLYKNNGNRHLIISFHGAAKENTRYPIFRNYDRNYVNSDMLSIFDGMLHKYKKQGLLLSWYTSTEKYNFDEVYMKIINHIIKKYNRVLFFGTSGGGFAALYYACKFNAHCLIGNSQLYLDKYKYYPIFEKIITDAGDKPIINNIEDVVAANSPKLITLSTNIDDLHHYSEHSQPFVKFCQDNNISCINAIFFKGTNATAHSQYFQTGHRRIINRFFK